MLTDTEIGELCYLAVGTGGLTGAGGFWRFVIDVDRSELGVFKGRSVEPVEWFFIVGDDEIW